MRKLTKLSLIIFIPFIGGLICIFVGSSTENQILFDIGFYFMMIGVPVMLFVLFIVVMVLMITGKLKDKNGSADNEFDKVGGVISKIYMHSGMKEKILGWLFFGFLMCDIALCLVFAFLGIVVGFLICLGIFVGTIILAILIKYIISKVRK